MERKRKFVSIHQEIRASRHDGGEEEDTANTYHLASQYLADSSLSEEVSQFLSMSISTSVSIYYIYPVLVLAVWAV